MGPKERREREKQETREKILDAARELFVTEGYEGVSMRKVAERIEYSPTAIYLHFSDKDELFRELCHQDFARLAEVFQSEATPTDPVRTLTQIGRTYAEFGRRYPNHYRLMFMTPHPFDGMEERDREIKGNPEVDAYAFLTSAVKAAAEHNVFREGLTDVEMIAQTLWAAIHGVIALDLAKRCDSWVDWRPLQDRVELMLEVVMRGLVKETK